MRLTIKQLAAVFASLLLFITITAQGQKLTPAQWQEDLRFLQKTVHTDYPFLFKKVTATEFDAAVETFYKQIPNMQDHEVFVGFARILSLFKYGHTDLSFTGGVVNYNRLPINLYSFKDGVYIEGTTKGNEQALGAKVLKIGDTPIDRAIELIKPTVPIENEMFFKAYGLNYLAIPEFLHGQRIIANYSMQVPFTLQKGGKTFVYNFTAGDKSALKRKYGVTLAEGESLSARDQSTTPLYLKELNKMYHFEYLPQQKTVYVRQSQVVDDPSENLATFYARVFDFIENNEVNRFVLDVRQNGGGNNYLNKPLITGLIKSKVNQVGKFYCIIGRRTFSACQNMINELDNYTNVIFVGEPSGENLNFYGDNRPVKLPNSQHTALLSFAWWQDKPQWENQQWMPPNISTDLSFEQYVSNQDPALEATFAKLADDVVLDPMGYLQELFLAGKYDKVGKEAARLVNDPMHKYTNFEALFAQAGNNLLNGGQAEGAVFVFDMSSKIFPDSAVTWLGLADALSAYGERDQAKQVYTKVSQMDLYGPHGEKARNKLKKM